MFAALCELTLNLLAFREYDWPLPCHLVRTRLQKCLQSFGLRFRSLWRPEFRSLGIVCEWVKRKATSRHAFSAADVVYGRAWCAKALRECRVAEYRRVFGPDVERGPGFSFDPLAVDGLLAACRCGRGTAAGPDGCLRHDILKCCERVGQRPTSGFLTEKSEGQLPALDRVRPISAGAVLYSLWASAMAHSVAAHVRAKFHVDHSGVSCARMMSWGRGLDGVGVGPEEVKSYAPRVHVLRVSGAMSAVIRAVATPRSWRVDVAPLIGSSLVLICVSIPLLIATEYLSCGASRCLNKCVVSALLQAPLGVAVLALVGCFAT